MSLLTEDRVRAAMLVAQYNADELLPGATPPADAIVITGIEPSRAVAFHPARLADLRPDVADWLSQLPGSFLIGESLSRANKRTDGVEWTHGELWLEALAMLALGLGLAHWTVERAMWAALPGLPYVTVHAHAIAVRA